MRLIPRRSEKMAPMKTLPPSLLASLTLVAGLVSSALAEPAKPNRLVNAYGEPAGFGNQSDVILPNTKELNQSQARPGSVGLFIMSGTFDRRNYESLGSWQTRSAMEARGRVEIGPLEVLDSGPTGPMTGDVLTAAREEVTAQVLTRIKATDKIMASLKRRSHSLDGEAQAQFQTVAQEVAERRRVLRENLKTVRAVEGDEWSNARAAVAVSFNAYVQSLHRAEEIVPPNASM